MNKKITLFLILAVLFLLTDSIKSQVTIGDNAPPRPGTVLDLKRTHETGVLGGLLLPHVDIKDLERIPLNFSDVSVRGADSAPEIAGTVVYNTNSGTGIGLYIWDGGRWRLLNSSGNLKTNDCQNTPVAVNGGIVACQVTDPDCTIEGEYRFEIVSGQNIVTLDVIDAGQGKFQLNFSPSDVASQRAVIVMAISPCGNSNMFVYTQNGDAAGCGTSIVPAIKSSNPGTGFELCPGGALFLYLDGRPSTGTYLWTLNGETVGSGSSYTATKAGRYIVYGDKVGCTNKQEIQVTMGTLAAPNAVQYIVVGNNGEACGAGGTVKLIVSNPVSGTVVWYKDGVKTTQTGKEITAGKGFWEAVVEDGNCASLPTPGVTIIEKAQSGSITDPIMRINGMLSGWSLCRNGSLFLEVIDMQPGTTYTWYADNTEIGQGTGIYYPVPSDLEQVVLRLRATGTGCAKEVLNIETIGVTPAPSAPFISTNTGNVLCGGQATLTATTPVGVTSYRWFRNGIEISGQTSNSITISQTGSYTVSGITSGGCTSTHSSPREIALSDFGTLAWLSHPTTVTEGETKTYSVSLDFNQSATYTWVVTGGTITNGQGTSAISVAFSTPGSATISCVATNACGTPSNSPLVQEVEVKAGCVSPQITGTSSLKITSKTNQSVTLSVTATGSPNRKYQWYQGGSTKITGAEGASYTFTTSTVGTFNYYCLVSVDNGCADAKSSDFTVTVTPNPSSIPTGKGSFNGKTCFDIAYSNDNQNSCAPLSGRISQRTDFMNTVVGSTNPYSGTQLYTFTPTGTVSNVRFDFVDPSGHVIESITPNADYSGKSISTPCLLTVVYKPSLNEDLKGLTRNNALKAEIYVIYNNNATGTGIDQSLKLTSTLSDCACCGAATVDGGWLNFMCHNLGADENIDPFTFVVGNTDGSGGTLGYLYQWGRKSDGHEKRNSPLENTKATNIEATLPIAVIGKLLNVSGDWFKDGGAQNRWGNGTNAYNQPKGINDPCPPGWKVPSQAQWGAIFRGGVLRDAPNKATANVWKWTGKGYKIGDSLYLPAGNSRFNYGTINGTVGTYGSYWSTSQAGTSGVNAHTLNISSTDVVPGNNDVYNKAASVRCVEE